MFTSRAVLDVYCQHIELDISLVIIFRLNQRRKPTGNTKYKHSALQTSRTCSVSIKIFKKSRANLQQARGAAGRSNITFAVLKIGRSANNISFGRLKRMKISALIVRLTA